MTIKEALIWGTKTLNKIAKRKEAHSDSPILDSEILLCAATKKPKEFIFTHPEKKLIGKQVSVYKKLIARRAKHEPIAYILSRKEFYGFEFFVNKDVLIPRPDTETLINAVIVLSPKTIIDIGTGGGAIAITLKKLLPKTQIFASDISPSALALAKKNAKYLGAKIIFKKGDLLEPFQSLLDTGFPMGTRYPIVITANLPYLSQKEWKNCQPEIKKHEPYGALVGEKTGTEVYEKLFKQISAIASLFEREVMRDFKNPPQPPLARGEVMLFLEIGHNQKSAIAKLAKKILKPKKIEFIKDLAEKWRVAKIQI